MVTLGCGCRIYFIFESPFSTKKATGDCGSCEGIILFSASWLVGDAYMAVLCLGASKNPRMPQNAALGRWGRTADTCTQSSRFEG